MPLDECSSFAIHDLAALTEGNLSAEGRGRLARHITQCRTCSATLAAIVGDARAAPAGHTSWSFGDGALGGRYTAAADTQRPGGRAGKGNASND